MNRTPHSLLQAAVCCLLLAACGGNRYVSADPELESIYLGKNYYDVVGEFGRPDHTDNDGRNGSKAVYSAVTLNRTSAAKLYRQHTIRNRRTKEEGQPSAAITFLFDANMRCYALESDFQRVRTPEVRQEVDKPDSPWEYSQVKPQVPRTLEFPKVERRSPFAEYVSVERIEVLRDETRITFSFVDRTPNRRPTHDKGLTIHGDVFVRDCATGERMKLVKPEGITLYPEYTPFAHNRGGYDMLVYTLVFESLPKNCQFIDIVEPGAEGFSFYNVDVRTSGKFRQTVAPMYH